MRKERVIKETRGVRFIRVEGWNYSSPTSNENSGEMEGLGKKYKKRGWQGFESCLQDYHLNHG